MTLHELNAYVAREWVANRGIGRPPTLHEMHARMAMVARKNGLDCPTFDDLCDHYRHIAQVTP